jgi:surfeit locus 1 family protein
VGVVRTNEKRPQFVSQISGSANLFLYRDIPGMCQLLSADPVFLDLTSVENTDLSPSYPIPGQTRATLRNEHVNYFITWFSLSLVTSLMWHRLFILKKPLR